MKKLLPYIIDAIKESKYRYEVHYFDSGAVMIDIWIGKSFYVIQIDGNTIGLSLVTEETIPFDIVPNQSFQDNGSFKKAFENILANSSNKFNK